MGLMGTDRQAVRSAALLVGAWLIAGGTAWAAPRVFTVDPGTVIKDLSTNYVGFDMEDFATGADFNWMLTEGRSEFAKYCRMTGQRLWRFGGMNRYSFRGEKVTRLLLISGPKFRGNADLRRKLEQQPLKWWFKPEDYFAFCRELNIKVLGTLDIWCVYDEKSGKVLNVRNHPEVYPMAAKEAAAWVRWVKDHGYLDLVPAWEIGNEDYNGKWDPVEYAKMVRMIIAETRKVDPGIKVSVCLFVCDTKGDPDVQFLMTQMKAPSSQGNAPEQIYQRYLRWSGDMLAALGDSVKDVAYATIHTYGGVLAYNANYKGLMSFENVLRAFPAAAHVRMMDTEWREASGQNRWCHRAFRYGALWRSKFALTLMAYPTLDYSAAHSLFGFAGDLYWSDGNRWAMQFVPKPYPQTDPLMAAAVDSFAEAKPRFDIGPFGPVTKMCNSLIDTHPYLLSVGADLGNMSSALYYQSAMKQRPAEGQMDDPADAEKANPQIQRDVQWLIAINKAKTSLSGVFVNTHETPVTVRLASAKGQVRMGAAMVQTLTCEPDKLDLLEMPGQDKFWHVDDYGHQGQQAVTLPANSVTRVVVPLDKK